MRGRLQVGTAFVAAVMLTGTAAQGALVHYYNFNEGSGSTAFDTGSVGGSNATLTAGAAFSTNTPFGGASNRSITTTNGGTSATGFTLGSQSSISVWAFVQQSTVAPQYLLDSNNSPSRTLIYTGFGSGESFLVFYNGQNFGTAGLVTATTPGWQNIVLSRNGTALSVYQNGVLRSTQTLSSAAAVNIGTWYFGQRFSVNERVSGQIDDYAFFDTALTPTEVANVYTTGIPEPTSLGAMAVAAAGLLARRRRTA